MRRALRRSDSPRRRDTPTPCRAAPARRSPRSGSTRTAGRCARSAAVVYAGQCADHGARVRGGREGALDLFEVVRRRHLQVLLADENEYRALHPRERVVPRSKGATGASANTRSSSRTGRCPPVTRRGMQWSKSEQRSTCRITRAKSWQAESHGMRRCFASLCAKR